MQEKDFEQSVFFTPWRRFECSLALPYLGVWSKHLGGFESRILVSGFGQFLPL